MPDDPRRTLLVQKMVAEGTSDDDIRATLKVFDAQAQTLSKATSIGPDRSLLSKSLDWLPTVGGGIGGVIGGAGGTALGMGFGGVPGAVGGATLGGATGEAIKQSARRLLGLPTAQSATEAAAGIGTEGAIQGGAELVGAGAAKGVIQPGARAVMRGYLKPSLAGVKIDKAREIVQTALDEALPVTQGGQARAGRLITELNKQINSALSGVTGKVDLHAVAEKVRTFAKAKYYKPGVDLSDFKAANDVADLIDQHPSLNLPEGAAPTRVDVSASQANEIKQAVRPNSRAFGQQGSAPEAATRKVAGSEMRQGIEDLAKSEGVGNIGALNAREGRLIDAQDAVKHAAGREENRNALFGMPTLLAGTIGAGEGVRQRDPAAGIATALAIRLMLSPALMTRAAIMASKLARTGYTASAAARLAVQTVRSESEQERDRNPQRP